MESDHFEKLLKHKEILEVLCSKKYNKKYKNTLLKKADEQFISNICEMCDNILNGNIKLTDKEFKQLKKHKKSLRLLIKRSSLRNKKKILTQQGGFLQYLIPAAISGISSIIGSLIKGGTSTEE